MPEFTPEKAANEMNGGTANVGSESGVSSGFGGEASRPGRNPLFATEPNKPIPEIEVSEGVDTPVAYLLRGLQKMANTDGIPAIADLAIATLLWLLRDTEARSRSDEGGSESIEDRRIGEGVEGGAGFSHDELFGD